MHSNPTSEYKSTVQDTQRSPNGLCNTQVPAYILWRTAKQRVKPYHWRAAFSDLFFFILPIKGNITLLILLPLVAIDAVPQSCCNACPVFTSWFSSQHFLHSCLLPLLLSVRQRYRPVPPCPSLLDSADNRPAHAQKNRLNFHNAVVPYSLSVPLVLVQGKFACILEGCFPKMSDFPSLPAARRPSLQACISNLATFASLRNSPVLNLSQHSAVDRFSSWSMTDELYLKAASVATCYCTTRPLTVLCAQKWRHSQPWHWQSPHIATIVDRCPHQQDCSRPQAHACAVPFSPQLLATSRIAASKTSEDTVYKDRKKKLPLQKTVDVFLEKNGQKDVSLQHESVQSQL